ncbi:DNA polymerase zeta catalytic subunit-like isoform X1 [Limulus polyphemus]|uniref:DNA polymerase zeta catalytic subunit n=1 Tax=Limulus polyphemus TaxID=6850 RepID=A0ABM1SY62_LIMPO|nr:DNA polymerase zeta catalytic subunit-like isoform X1 [Limulus polyphemus]XP_022248568.1 DNA polymerase zeta catalytic subunit-like isoform X1 [Limulus polyphemus]
MFSLRIVTVDHYQTFPRKGLDAMFSEFRGCDVKKVPVVRIFGVMHSGQKACLHVHGVFPYLTIPWEGPLAGPTSVAGDRYIHQMTHSIDSALNISLGNSASNMKHVHNVTVISGIPLYGYHEKEQYFLKICLYNPLMTKRVAELLQTGAVMNKVIQPHEAHVPYILQFFIDYNLYGMNFINVSALKFRRPSRKQDEISSWKLTSDSNFQVWDIKNLPEDFLLDESVEKITTCEVECDCQSKDITNHLEIQGFERTNPGLKAIWEDARRRKLDNGESSKLTPQQSQERENVKESESAILLKQKLWKLVQNVPINEVKKSDLTIISSGSNSSLNINSSPSESPNLHASSVEDLTTSPVLRENEHQTDVDVKEEKADEISFSQCSNLLDSCDLELVETIAGLAENDYGSEDMDSILSTQPLKQNDESEADDDDLVTLEMSQRFWEDENLKQLKQSSQKLDENPVSNENPACHENYDTKTDICLLSPVNCDEENYLQVPQIDVPYDKVQENIGTDLIMSSTSTDMVGKCSEAQTSSPHILDRDIQMSQESFHESYKHHTKCLLTSKDKNHRKFLVSLNRKEKKSYGNFAVMNRFYNVPDGSLQNQTSVPIKKDQNLTSSKKSRKSSSQKTKLQDECSSNLKSLEQNKFQANCEPLVSNLTLKNTILRDLDKSFKLRSNSVPNNTCRNKILKSPDSLLTESSVVEDQYDNSLFKTQSPFYGLKLSPDLGCEDFKKLGRERVLLRRLHLKMCNDNKISVPFAEKTPGISVQNCDLNEKKIKQYFIKNENLVGGFGCNTTLPIYSEKERASSASISQTTIDVPHLLCSKESQNVDCRALEINSKTENQSETFITKLCEMISGKEPHSKYDTKEQNLLKNLTRTKNQSKLSCKRRLNTQSKQFVEKNKSSVFKKHSSCDFKSFKANKPSKLEIYNKNSLKKQKVICTKEFENKNLHDHFHQAKAISGERELKDSDKNNKISGKNKAQALLESDECIELRHCDRRKNGGIERSIEFHDYIPQINLKHSEQNVDLIDGSGAHKKCNDDGQSSQIFVGCPTSSELKDDHQFTDAMWKLSYLSPLSLESAPESPPMCWSPKAGNFSDHSSFLDLEDIFPEREKELCKDVCSYHNLDTDRLNKLENLTCNMKKTSRKSPEYRNIKQSTPYVNLSSDIHTGENIQSSSNVDEFSLLRLKNNNLVQMTSDSKRVHSVSEAEDIPKDDYDQNRDYSMGIESFYLNNSDTSTHQVTMHDSLNLDFVTKSDSTLTKNVMDSSKKSVSKKRLFNYEGRVWTLKKMAPSRDHVQSTLSDYGLSAVPALKVFSSDPADLPVQQLNKGDQMVQLQGPITRSNKILEWAQKFTAEQRRAEGLSSSFCLIQETAKKPRLKTVLASGSSVVITPAILPPNRKTVDNWLQMRKALLNQNKQQNTMKFNSNLFYKENKKDHPYYNPTSCYDSCSPQHSNGEHHSGLDADCINLVSSKIVAINKYETLRSKKEMLLSYPLKTFFNAEQTSTPRVMKNHRAQDASFEVKDFKDDDTNLVISCMPKTSCGSLVGEGGGHITSGKEQCSFKRKKCYNISGKCVSSVNKSQILNIFEEDASLIKSQIYKSFSSNDITSLFDKNICKFFCNEDEDWSGKKCLSRSFSDGDIREPNRNQKLKDDSNAVISLSVRNSGKMFEGNFSELYNSADSRKKCEREIVQLVKNYKYDKFIHENRDVSTSENFLEHSLSPILKTPDSCSLTPQHNPESQSQENDLCGKEKLLEKQPLLSCNREVQKLQKSPHLPFPFPQSSLRRKILDNQFMNWYFPRKQISVSSQIEGPSPENTFGFKISFGNVPAIRSAHEFQYLTVMSVEVHVQTRGSLFPDPSYDSVTAVFYCMHNDVPSDWSVPKEQVGVIIVQSDKECNEEQVDKHYVSRNSGLDLEVCTLDKKLTEDNKTCVTGLTNESPVTLLEEADACSKLSGERNINSLKKHLLTKCGLPGIMVTYVKNEIALFQQFTHLVHSWDPDILVGYEVQMLSWGFLLERATHLKYNLCSLISRVPTSKGSHFSTDRDEYGADHMSEIHLEGRVILNLWRLIRKEVILNIYTFENVYYHVLHQRVPLYSRRTLSDWFSEVNYLNKWRVIEYFIIRVQGNLQLLEKLDIIGKTSELARVFGIQFYDVLSRGSQFRVESMMLRSAKPHKYVPVTPSIQQRARARAPESIPLIMEPESRFYTNPVLVLDFQSLYPSIIIAYNYCFSTCLGRLEHLGRNEPFEFGCTSLAVPPELLKLLWKDITISPNGVVFVKSSVRQGVLPQMLNDILNTRIMVKNAMKDYKNNKGLLRLLDAQQMGLKMLANTTYGYTGANYSGRMPCVEVADSIVSKARETLEQAIQLVESTSKWKARVVYGDTDSMFVHLPGKSKIEAFKIGEEIAEAVTSINPKPVKLKFEKVYFPCVLQTKKRYVGFMYENINQKDPVYDAKGIETVRRDSCPAAQKVLEKSLKILFTTYDVTAVKLYVQKQFQKLISGRASIQDCIFAKEYRGLRGYRPGARVPALEIARRLLRADPRAEPRVGERVPYVIVYGFPGLPLIQLVKQPQEVIYDPGMKINAQYYISRSIIPPLERIFSLMGVNVVTWYSEMPRTNKTVLSSEFHPHHKKGTLSQYFTTLACPVCEEETTLGLCIKCRNNAQSSVFILNDKIRKMERAVSHLEKICQSCKGSSEKKNMCISLDCPVLFRATLCQRDLGQAPYLQQLLNYLTF